METFVDARGLSCPQPVIRTKKALEQMKDGCLVTVVDNEVARDNVIKLARSLNCAVEVEQKQNEYYIRIKKGELTGMKTGLAVESDTVMLITSDALGRGEEELGKILMESFFYTLTESEVLPRSILFVNRGVYLTCEGSPVISHLLELEKKGVEILSCGTCLDYYRLKAKLCVGNVTNMYNILENMLGAGKTISL
ncbi:sulfurtransferase-like selenium metabolism protein YedF [Calderihabitans maritimus]|uniref:SirA-like protein n=1 Tax=Calderihabitans maritimus TaxID=1246530 RepID=A0A1Z5HVZ8_9FIRM|nr:sulfurtransferase-like selenium metabolism protein YedF [Calderihabitans maritimus]GAW93704.1 SirA-like protein [Calderihabitans maritimus]